MWTEIIIGIMSHSEHTVGAVAVAGFSLNAQNVPQIILVLSQLISLHAGTQPQLFVIIHRL